MSNSQARVEAIFAEAAELFKSKNAVYGDSWRHNGWRGNLSRIMEKAGRLRNMLWRDGNVLLNGGKEHPRETALDMINTLAFMITNMDDGVEWGHEPRAKEIPPPFDRELEQLRLSYGNPALTRTDLDRLRNENGFSWPEGSAPAITQVGEQTVVEPIIGEVPPPGEEADKPSPRKRNVTVTDRGSGPRRQRPVADTPQA